VNRGRRRRPRQEVALRVTDPEIADALELVEGLDPLGDDDGVEVAAEADHVTGDDLLAALMQTSKWSRPVATSTMGWKATPISASVRLRTPLGASPDS
jgi:hypothetical protein